MYLVIDVCDMNTKLRIFILIRKCAHYCISVEHYRVIPYPMYQLPDIGGYKIV